MIPIEARIDELEGDLGRVAAWMEYRHPEIGPIRLHSAIQDEGVLYRHISAVMIQADGVEVEPGLALEEAKRCLRRYGWLIKWYSGSPIAAAAWSDASALRPTDWIDTMIWLEDGDPVFGPD